MAATSHPNRRQALALLCLGGALGTAASTAQAQVASPHAIDIPAWFTESFLDFKDEAATAARDGKRLLVYFGQDGCPYCRELMVNNFSQPAIVEKTRRHFVAIALNLWGDREVTWIDGRRMSEKEFARMLKVQFTPTLLFLDGDARIVARLNGYHPPQRLAAALDFVAGRMETRTTLAEHLNGLPADPARTSLNEHPAFMKPPFDFSRRPAGSRPLAVIFETRSCLPCDEMHRDGLTRAEVRKQLPRLDIARFALGDATQVVTPSGQRRSAAAWAREIGVAYTPTWVFFDAGREVFRIDGYLRPFHLATSLEYVAGRDWRREPEFQRYIRAKAERLRDAGRPVELWR